MRINLASLLSLVAMAACTMASENTAAWRARADGAGPVRVGMTAAEARTALGLGASTSPAVEGCAYLAGTANTRLHANVMLTSDTVVRIDVLDTLLRTNEGARVGDSEARIKQLYAGRVTVQPHKYTSGGHYLVVTTPDNARNRLVFETDGRVVTRYRVGREPEVEQVEGRGSTVRQAAAEGAGRDRPAARAPRLD